MLIQNWMTTDVVSVGPDATLLKIGKLLKEKNIRRVPVVDEGNRVLGIISDRDVKAASPSKATSLDMHEINYLLAKVTAKDIMTKNPITIGATDTIEKAAMLMLDHRCGSLPVVEESGRVVGIITDHDVFKAMVDTTGVRQGGFQLGLRVPDTAGAMQPVFDILRSREARILSVATINENDATRKVFIRLRSMNTREAEDALVEAVREKAQMLYWVRNTTHMD